MQLADIPHPFARAAPPWHGIVIALLGTAAVVIGSFLPWLQSGSTTRNLYSATATWQQFISASDFAVTRLMPWLGAVLMIPVVVGVVGYLRIAAVAALAIGVLGLTVTIIATIEISSRARFGVSLGILGPMIVGAGTILLGCGAGMVLRASFRR